jgi:hypothetical protein
MLTGSLFTGLTLEGVTSGGYKFHGPQGPLRLYQITVRPEYITPDLTGIGPAMRIQVGINVSPGDRIRIDPTPMKDLVPRIPRRYQKNEEKLNTQDALSKKQKAQRELRDAIARVNLLVREADARLEVKDNTLYAKVLIEKTL